MPKVVDIWLEVGHVNTFFRYEQNIQNEVRRLQNPRFLSIIVHILKGDFEKHVQLFGKKNAKKENPIQSPQKT